MKVGDLIDWLMLYNDNEEIEIETYETISGRYIDTTADIVVAEDAAGPTLRVDVEAEKFRRFLT